MDAPTTRPCYDEVIALRLRQCQALRVDPPTFDVSDDDGQAVRGWDWLDPAARQQTFDPS